MKINTVKLLLGLDYFKSNHNFDYDNTYFIVAYKKYSRAFDYLSMEGKTLIHDPGGFDYEIVSIKELTSSLELIEDFNNELFLDLIDKIESSDLK